MTAVREWYELQPPEVQAVVDAEALAAQRRIADGRLLMAMAGAEDEFRQDYNHVQVAQSVGVAGGSSMTQYDISIEMAKKQYEYARKMQAAQQYDQAGSLTGLGHHISSKLWGNGT